MSEPKLSLGDRNKVIADLATLSGRDLEKLIDEKGALESQVDALKEQLKRFSQDNVELTLQESGTHFSKEYWKERAESAEARLAEAEKSGKLFCAEQCEEGPGWGECEESGCHLFAIKKALGGGDAELFTRMAKLLSLGLVVIQTPQDDEPRNRYYDNMPQFKFVKYPEPVGVVGEATEK